MFIKYNNTNIHALGTPDGKSISWLRPGWNEFPKHMWDMYKDHVSIKKMLDDKMIELLNEKITVVKGKKKTTIHIGINDEPIDVKVLPEPKAIEIIKATFNRDILQRWLDEENRHKVKRELEKQIKPLLQVSKAS